ncbi:MAG: RIP metalloprotease RseP [Candidatus Acidiferrum sp.]
MVTSIFFGTVLMLGVLITVHEWGHFIVARLFGVRVDVFSIGFGPRLFGVKRGATDYRVSAIPLGGYVRMAGQDLSEVDSAGPAPTGAPDELTSKPRWQRALISLAGPVVNLILPIFLFGVFYWVHGTPYPQYLDQPAVIAGLSQNDPLAHLGVNTGDRIVAVNGVSTPTWEKADEKILDPANDLLHLTTEHQGTTRIVDVHAKELADPKVLGSYHPIPPLIDEIAKGDPAHRAGMKSGDLIVSVNDRAIANFPELVDIIQRSNGGPLKVSVLRDAKPVLLTMQAKWISDKDGKFAYRIGIGPKIPVAYKKVSVSTAFGEALQETWSGTVQLLSTVSKLVTGKLSVNQLQGVVSIADQSGQAMERGSLFVVNMMAIISLNLGILNLLPIPILDGGNILLLSIEGLLRRDMSMAFKIRFVQAGLVFLLLVFTVVMKNDIMRRLPFHS